MACKQLLAAVSMIVAAPVSAAHSQPAPGPALPSGMTATGQPEYCLWVEPATGSRLETVQCWTRDVWADAGVDVDKEWAKEGVLLPHPASGPSVSG